MTDFDPARIGDVKAGFAAARADTNSRAKKTELEDAVSPLASKDGSNVSSAEDWRTALALGDAATKNIGNAPGTVAAGDDARLEAVSDKADLNLLNTEVSAPLAGSLIRTAADKFGDVLDGRDFGIRPSTSAALNASRLNAVMAAIKAAGGGTLHLVEAGDYQINSTVILRTGVSLLMEPQSWLKWTGSAAGTAVESDPADVLRGCNHQINLNTNGMTGKSIKLHSAYDCKFEWRGDGIGTNTFLDVAADSAGGENGIWKRNHANCTHRVKHIGTVGRLIRMSGKSPTDSYDGGPQVVTLCTFEDVQGWLQTIVAVDIVNWTDNNSFTGFTRLGADQNNAIGVWLNSGSETTDLGVYSNKFENLAVDTFGTYTNRIGIKFGPGKLNVVDLFHQDPTAEGGEIVVLDSCISYYVRMKERATGRLVVSSRAYVAQAQFYEGPQEFVLADDAAASFSLAAVGDNTNHAILMITGTSPLASGQVWVKPKAGGAEILKLSGDATYFITTTGPLSGTTGTDNRFTVSCHTNGRVYVENRLGGDIVVNVTGIGGLYQP